LRFPGAYPLPAASTPIGDDGWIAVAWCLVLSLAGYLWARRLYERVPARAGA
jgi:hypothetical protein